MLLEPTLIYVRQVFDILQHYRIKGMSHITGGGLTENVPRMFPDGISAILKKGSWKVPPIFRWLQDEGGIDEEEMFRVFNMGVGMAMVF